MRLAGQTAIVTGASKGIGKAIAIGMAKEGAKIAAIGRDPKRIEEVIDEINKSGRESMGIRADVTNLSDVNRFINEVAQKFQEIHILVNCAGGSLGTSRLTKEVKKEEWDYVINLNLKAPFLCSKAVFPSLFSKASPIAVFCFEKILSHISIMG